MSLGNVKGLAAEIGELSDLIKRCTEKKKELEKELRPLIVDRGTILFGEYQFTCKTVVGRRTLNKQSLIDAGVDVEAHMKVSAPSTTLTIKKVEVV